MTDVHVVHTRVFSLEDGGNPCPVVVDAATLTSEQMRAVARRFGQECGFVVSARDDPRLALRFFVPEHEMSMCVHATIAVISVLADHGRLAGDQTSVTTPVGLIQTSWAAAPHAGGTVDRVSVSQLDAAFSDHNPAPPRVAEALGMSPDDFDATIGPIRSVSTSRPKLIVPVATEDVLHSLSPHWSQMWDLCTEFDTTGIYAVCRGATADEFHARQFPVRAGYPEDPATGVAAGALAAHLTERDHGDGVNTYRIHQGEAMGSPGLLFASARWSGNRVTDVSVAGHVTTVGSERIALAELAHA